VPPGAPIGAAAASAWGSIDGEWCSRSAEARTPFFAPLIQ
jgi:hypothetical protein